MEYLTEAQAWRQIAARAKRTKLGLCNGLHTLRINCRISTTTLNQMWSRIDFLPRLSSGYAWPRTPKGYMKRTAWAKRQARLAEKAAVFNTKRGK